MTHKRNQPSTPTEKELYSLMLRSNLGTIYLHHTINIGDGCYQPQIDFFLPKINSTSGLCQRLSSQFHVCVRSVAIEVQDSGSRKHRMGDIINATYNGDVGIVVCSDKGKLDICNAILNYLRRKEVVSQQHPLLVLHKETFIEYLGKQDTANYT